MNENTESTSSSAPSTTGGDTRNKNLLEPELGQLLMRKQVKCRSCGTMIGQVGLYDMSMQQEPITEVLCPKCWEMLWKSFTRVALKWPHLMYLHNWHSEVEN